MKKPEKLLLSVLAVALLTVCFGHTGFAFAQNGGPTDASATVTLLEGIDSARSQPGHQYRAVLDKPISVSGISVPRGTPAIVVLTQARAGNAAIWTLQLTGFVVGGAPVAVNGTSPTLPKSFGNVLGQVNSAGQASAAGLRVFLRPEQVVNFALGRASADTSSYGGPPAPQGRSSMVQVQSGIRFELTGCYREDVRAVCNFYATNLTANDVGLTFCGNTNNMTSSYMVDQSGNKVSEFAWKMGDSSDRHLMVPGVRTAGQVAFQKLDSRATSALRMAVAYSVIEHRVCENSFVFSGVPIPDHVIEQSPAPSVPDATGGALPANALQGRPIQIRGQIGYALQDCTRSGVDLVCTIGEIAQVANPRHITLALDRTFLVDTNGTKINVAQMQFGEDPTHDAVFIQNHSIPLTLTFQNTSEVSQIARLELGGSDGSDFTVRWANVPILPEPVRTAAGPGGQGGAASNPGSYELAGVHLRMSGREALAALEKKFAAHAVLSTGLQANTQGLIYLRSKKVYTEQAGQYISAIHYRNKVSKIDVDVELAENYPYDKDLPELVTRVVYTFHTVTDPDFWTAFTDASGHYLAEFGPPRFRPSQTEVDWCRPLDARASGCDQNRASFTIGGSNNGLQMTLSDAGIAPPIRDRWDHRRVVETKPIY